MRLQRAEDTLPITTQDGYLYPHHGALNMYRRHLGRLTSEVNDISRGIMLTSHQDGKNYISLAQANPTRDDPRSQGYTLLARCIFESKEDMDYYDNEDEAHAKIKAHFKPKVNSPPLVIYSDMQ
jgi:hypothetical protein